MVEQKKLPGYIYLPPDAARRQADLTSNGIYNLITCEVPWKDRYEYLLKKGYKLRARYNPKWKPSWTGTNLDPDFCEDSVVLNVRLLDCC